MSEAAGGSSTAAKIKVPLMGKVRFNITEPTEYFAGRSTFFELLDSTITKNREVLKEEPTNVLSQVVIVTGISGIGKTETLRKYLQSYGSLYDHMVWITMDTGYLDAFRKLSQELSNGLDTPDFVQDIYSKLCSEMQKLILVLDEAPTLGIDSSPPVVPLEEIMTKLLPGTSPHPLNPPVILITSKRFPNPPDYENSPTKCLPLGPWKYEESLSYIRRALNKQIPEDDTAGKLVNIFGRYPAVLSLVVSCLTMGKKHCRFRLFNYMYKSNGTYTLSELFVKSNGGFPVGQWERLELIEYNAQENGPFAVHVLKIASSLENAFINTFLLEGLFAEEISNDPSALQSALNLLVSYGCLTKKDLNEPYIICQDIQDAILQLPQSQHSLSLGLVNEGRLTKEHAEYLETTCCYEDNIILRDLSRRLTNLIPTLEKSNPFYETVIAIATRVASRTFNKALAREAPPPTKYTEAAVDWVDRILKSFETKIKGKNPLFDESRATLALDALALKVRKKFLMGIPGYEASEAERQMEFELRQNLDSFLEQIGSEGLTKLDPGTSSTSSDSKGYKKDI